MLREDNPLLKAKNCIIKPHISWAPKESRERLMHIATENLKSYIDGKLMNIVNYIERAKVFTSAEKFSLLREFNNIKEYISCYLNSM